ncbi:MAG TPA: BTAD domain-containing putative transcriptional regulator [Solirubrobacterales bacterium]|nr:BTAD domain-containing putative transcriptional regulator [Solirubrobacterales bacterium]
MAFEVRLLGSVEALADGRSLSLGGSKQRSVVAMLALRANRTVSTDDLIDGLWGDDPPPSAAKNVQLYVSRLRRALGANDSVARIVTHGRGYELQLPEDAVDAARFERLVERAQRQAEQGIVNGAAQGALELWRGAPLADVASEPFAAPEIRRLEELRLRAIELMIDAELAAGRHGEVIGTLEALLVDHPLNERFHAQRMLALYRSGRQADALEAYREATRTLIDQIGVRPGPELGRLEQAILDQDPSLELSAPQEELPPQLEGGSPLLAGRERECRWLRKRWEEAETHRCRLALISGPAGIGKTRLAAEVATELQRTGVAVLYASGAGAPESALETVQSVAKNERPTLLVLDDADDASPALLHAPTDLVAEARESPLLVLALCRDDQGPSALTALETAGAAQRLRLRPLRAEAIAEIATLYERTDTMAMPLETLMAESEGVALRIHRAASAWAQERTAERLEATVSSAATGRGGLRAVEAQLAGTVADLQATREHARLYLAEDPDPTAPDVCPFRGLAPFHSAHAEYFFGRERLVADLVARIVGSALLAVVGPSGSGKSSLVRAGLLPALASGVLPGSERWRQAVMRPGPQPVEELRRALARLAPGDRQIDPDDPFTAVLGSLGPDERLVLAVDQLEEIFAACRDEGERRAFAEQLVTAAVYPDHRLVVVLAIRGDFYDRCAEYPALASEMSANTVLVGPMRREELRRAIELPARAAGLRVEPRLVSALVGEVADEPGGLPLLSTTLLELWEQRDGRTLGYSTYEASGGVSGAVARLAERAYQRLSAPQRERARQILMRLVDAEEMEPVARRVPLSELELERDEDAAAALSVLTESRLVTVDEGTAEVAHEALLREWPRLRGWLEDDAQGWRLRQHLTHAAGEWQGSGREPAELYRGARLASALGWAETHDPELNELEREFLEESRAGSEREAERQRRTNRRLRSLLVGVGVLLTLAVIAGVIARSERQSARSAATAEAAQRLGAQALTEERVDRAALLATAGVVLDDSLATRSSLLSTLVRNPALLGVLGGDGDPLNALALSPDGRTLAIGDEDGTVTFYDTETRAPMNTFQTHGFVTGLAFDPRGRSVAITSKDEARGGVAEFSASLHIIDADTLDARRSTRLGYQPVTDPRASQDYFPIVTYAAGGRSVVVGYVDISGFDQPLFLRRFDARGGEALGGGIPVGPSGFWGDLLVAPDGRLFYTTNNATYAIDAKTFDLVRRYPVGGLSSGISADGTTLAIGSKDGRVRLLDLASGRVQTLNGRHEAGVQDEAFTPDGRMLATSDEDATVIVWDLRTGRITERLTGHRSEDTFLRGIPELTFSPDGRTLYSASFDSTAIIWDVAGDRRLGRPFTAGDRVRIQDRWPPAFSISPDGRTLAVASLNGRVNRIDAETLQSTGSFEALPAFESHKTPAAAIEYTPDGRRLAVGGGRGLVGLWNASSGQRAGPLLHAPPRGGFCAGKPTFGSICFEAVVQAVAVGTGGLVAAASLRGVVRIWDLDSRELIRPPLHLQRIVIGLAFSPDGSQLAIPTGLLEGDPAVEIRDPRSGERIARLVPQNEVRTVAFSPDGRLLAAGQVDGSTTLWTTDGWTQVGQPLVRPERVLGVAFSPDGRTLATSHGDGTVVLWDLESRQPIGAPLPGPAGDWVTARFTPDGSHLFAVYESGTAIRWEVDPAVWRQHACAVADGGLTREEWEEVVPEQDYLEVCPG